jgi:hypothetical protein
MRPFYASILTATLFAGLPAVAQPIPPNCAERDLVVERLESTFGEAFAGGGLQSDTQLLEVWRSPEQGTWTLLMTGADGLTCVVASGTHWQGEKLAEKAKGTPS